MRLKEGRKMGYLSNWVFSWGAIALISAVGCSDDSKDGGDGDGDQSGSGGFVTTTGGRSSGDGDVLDPCFGATVYCNNGCADLTTDETNCGRCGERCGSAENCEDRVCVDAPDPSMGGGGGAGGVGGEGGSRI